MLEKSESYTECGRRGEKGEHIVSVYTCRVVTLSIDRLNALIRCKRSTFTSDIRYLCARRIEGSSMVTQIAFGARSFSLLDHLLLYIQPPTHVS